MSTTLRCSVLPVDARCPILATDLFDLFYSDVVRLAHAVNPRIIEEPEAWLRSLGCEVSHEVRWREGASERAPQLEKRPLRLVAREGRRVHVLPRTFRQLVVERAWHPWLVDRGWQDVTGDPKGTPLWLCPSGKAYPLFFTRDRQRARPQSMYPGLGVALAREGLDPEAVLKGTQRPSRVTWDRSRAAWATARLPLGTPEAFALAISAVLKLNVGVEREP